MAKTRYTLIDYIDQGNDHGAELILSNIKPLFAKIRRALDEDYSSNARMYLTNIERELYGKED